MPIVPLLTGDVRATTRNRARIYGFACALFIDQLKHIMI